MAAYPERLIAGWKGNFIDAFDKLASNFLSSEKEKPIDLKSLKRVLFIRLDNIGDLLMAIPAIEILAQSLPNAEIDLMCRPSAGEIVQGNPHISQIIPYHPRFLGGRGKKSGYVYGLSLMKKGKYSAIFLPRGDFREIGLAFLAKAPIRIGIPDRGGGPLLTHSVKLDKKAHDILKNCHILGPLGLWHESKPQEILNKKTVYISDEEYIFAAKLLEKLDIKSKKSLNFLQEKENTRETLEEDSKEKNCENPINSSNIKPLIILHTGAASQEKRWPLEKFLNLGQKLADLGYKILILRGPEDKEYSVKIRENANIIVPEGLFPLRVLGAFLGLADCLVVNDSAPMHIGIGQNTPTVAIFGPTNSNLTGPISLICPHISKHLPRDKHIESTNHCVITANVPCGPCWYPGTPFDCPHGLRCLKEIQVETVINHIEKITAFSGL